MSICYWPTLTATVRPTAALWRSTRTGERWNQKSLINIARSGIFAADRSIRDYARDIWHVPTRFD